MNAASQNASISLLEAGDLEEILVTLVAIADPDWSRFRSDLHGTAEQRAVAFAIGVDEGAGTCTSEAFVNLFPEPPPP